MNSLISSNDELRQYIANVVHEVDDEATLFEKMAPSLVSATEWMKQNISADTSVFSEDESSIAKMLVAKRAFFFAAPSLDLVLTPNGFGVVNTTNIAPASKERVDRLRDALLQEANELAFQLVEMLRYNSAWAESPSSAKFRSCFLSMDMAKNLSKEGEAPLDAFDRLLPLAMDYQKELEASFLGKTLSQSFVSAAFLKQHSLEAYCAGLFSQALLNYLSFAQKVVDFSAKEKYVWICSMNALRFVSSQQQFRDVWIAEVGDLFDCSLKEVRPGKQGGCWI